MVHIEEIPDEEPLNHPHGLKNEHLSLDRMIAEAASAHFGRPMTGADLPDAIAAVKSVSADEFIRQMNKMPLFMTELDETGENDEGPNEALEAIKALQEEGDPWEVAQNFKISGNERFKVKNYEDAREFYTKALNVNCDRDDINVACLNNRAQCNLEMRNYRKCITDCKAALKLDVKQDKAWFRAAKALLALDKIEEAEACIDNAIMLKPDHTQVADLGKKIKARKDHLEKMENQRKERERKKKWEEEAIKMSLQAREISTKSTKQPPEMPDGVKIKFMEEGKIESGLLFPVLLIYHLHLQTDMIAAMPETTSVGDQLTEVLAEPLEWDEQREYNPNSVECYMETKTGGLVKVGKNVSLLAVLSNGKCEITDGLVRILVVPKKRNAEFIENWKKTMKKA
jgi:tetratricopeptide (TPR) repeat protein